MVTWLAQALRAGGCSVGELAGWQARGHGQMKGVLGVLGHHTAGPLTGNSPSFGVVVNGRPDLPGPLANLFLDRAGHFTCVAAGLAYHAGPGVLPFCPRDQGNDYLIGIEAESAGIGDWTVAQLAAYPMGVAALLSYAGLPASRFAGHMEYAPARKIDPAGWPGGMNGFRATVDQLLNPPPRPKHRDTEDAMFIAMGPTPEARLALLSGGVFRELSAGEKVTAQDTIKRQGALELYVEQSTWDFFQAASNAITRAAPS